MVYTSKIITRLHERYKHLFDYSFIVFLAGINSVLNYIASIYVNRNLSISDFAEYNAILSIYNIITITISSYSYYIMQTYHNAYESRKKSYWVYLLIADIFIVILYLSLTPLMPIFFNIRALNIYALFSFNIFFTILLIVPQSILRANGLIKFDYSINVICNILIKFLLLGVFIFTGFSIVRASVTIISYIFFSFLLSIIVLKKNNLYSSVDIRNIKSYVNKDETFNIIKIVFPILISNAVFNLLSSFDILMSIRFLDKEHAGYYATISIITRMFFYISSTIGSIMYAMLIANNKNKEGHKKENGIIILSFISNMVIITIFSLVLFLFGREIILVQFTDKYESIISFIPQMILFGFSISLMAMFFNYCLFYKWYKPFYLYIPKLIIVYISLRNSERTFAMFIHIFTIFFIVLMIYNLSLLIFHLIRYRKKTT